VGAEARGKADFYTISGGFTFSYVVFDEVHCLDSEEGDALQRLIRLVECPFLALSATIGNPDDLCRWWQTVRNTHIDVLVGVQVIVVLFFKVISPSLPPLQSRLPLDAQKDGKLVKRAPDVQLEQYEERFINIQRLVFDHGRLRPLHPCAGNAASQPQRQPATESTMPTAVTVEALRSTSLRSLSMSMTPRDVVALWEVRRRRRLPSVA
jgi:hypothetical protein